MFRRMYGSIGMKILWEITITVGWNITTVSGISKCPIRNGKSIRQIHPIYGILGIEHNINAINST